MKLLQKMGWRPGKGIGTASVSTAQDQDDAEGMCSWMRWVESDRSCDDDLI
jgi:hypothetical protein